MLSSAFSTGFVSLPFFRPRILALLSFLRFFKASGKSYKKDQYPKTKSRTKAQPQIYRYASENGAKMNASKTRSRTEQWQAHPSSFIPALNKRKPFLHWPHLLSKWLSFSFCLALHASSSQGRVAPIRWNAISLVLGRAKASAGLPLPQWPCLSCHPFFPFFSSLGLHPLAPHHCPLDHGRRGGRVTSTV
jgi:hypothetical protein